MTQQFLLRRDVRVVLESWEEEKGACDRMGLVFLLGFLFEPRLLQRSLLAGFTSSIQSRIQRHKSLSAEPRASYQPGLALEAIDLHPTDARDRRW